MDLHYRPGMRCADRKVFVTAGFTCLLSSTTKSMTRWESRQLLQLIEVKIPADERDQQRIREAMELFTMLAAVSNKVFLSLVAKYMKVDCFAEHPDAVFPVWFCKLVGKLQLQRYSHVIWTNSSVLRHRQLFSSVLEVTLLN